MPMKFRISSQYGVLEEIRNGRIHNGVDLAMPKGTELRSIAEGIVDHVVDQAGGLGKGVLIRTGNGDLHVYGHLDRISVNVGEKVNAGEVIGLSGNSGHSTGPHLHFALQRGGEFADPTPLVGAVQHYSGEIAGPSIFGIKGPAIWMAEKALGAPSGIKEHVKSKVQEQIYSFLSDVLDVVFDLSFVIGLIGCTVLIILGAVGLRDGYRWSAVLFTVCALIRMTLGGAR